MSPSVRPQTESSSRMVSTRSTFSSWCGLVNEKRVLGVLTNQRPVLGVLTNERRVLKVLTNERGVLRVLTNERRVLPVPGLPGLPSPTF